MYYYIAIIDILIVEVGRWLIKKVTEKQLEYVKRSEDAAEIQEKWFNRRAILLIVGIVVLAACIMGIFEK